MDLGTGVFDIPPKRFVTSGFPKKQLLFEFNNIRLFSNTNYYYLCAMPGVDEGQRHSLGGRRRLFPRVQRNNVGDQRGKRPCATSSAPKICTRSKATARKFLDPCRQFTLSHSPVLSAHNRNEFLITSYIQFTIITMTLHTFPLSRTCLIEK